MIHLGLLDPALNADIRDLLEKIALFLKQIYLSVILYMK